VKAKIIVDAERCVGCGDCVYICPVGVYRLKGKKSVPADSGSCCGATCKLCVQYCWKDAILQRDGESGGS
jgi:NAD-dependent dihydropyrimidine dehydrogenase PreA subunit